MARIAVGGFTTRQRLRVFHGSWVQVTGPNATVMSADPNPVRQPLETFSFWYITLHSFAARCSGRAAAC